MFYTTEAEFIEDTRAAARAYRSRWRVENLNADPWRETRHRSDLFAPILRDQGSQAITTTFNLAIIVPTGYNGARSTFEAVKQFGRSRVFPYRGRTFIDRMTRQEARRYQRYWERDAPRQVQPGPRQTTDYFKPSRRSRGEVYRRDNHYDQYGRTTGRTDYTFHGDTRNHMFNPHHHRIEYNAHNPNGIDVINPANGRNHWSFRHTDSRYYNEF